LIVFTVSGSVHPSCCQLPEGPTKENQIWIVKTNKELDKLIKHKNIINHIKAQRVSWFGHVQRMPDTRTVKKIFNP
jgi:hypothetical protein